MFSISVSSEWSLEPRNGVIFCESSFRDGSSRPVRKRSSLGLAASECSRSITRFEAVTKAMVAGASAGAGAEEVVCVRDCRERDLSRSSTID